MGNTSPGKFVEEVKQEGKKVTWPTAKDTRTSTLMVLVMVAISGVFFFIADWVISSVIQMVLGV